MPNPLIAYWPITRRPRLEWPNGARLAFWIGLNIEYFEPGKPSTSISGVTTHLSPDPLNAGWRDYGTRVGIWRTMELLDRLGMRASVLLNSDVCEQFPEIIEAGNQRNWAWLAHGKTNSILTAGMSPEQERQFLGGVVQTIAQRTGKQPRGWLGPALSESLETPQILADLGIRYICDWCNDDQPYPMHVERGQLISVPYSIELNDISVFLGKGLEAEGFSRMIVDQIDVLLEESAASGRVMAVALHPFLTGLPFRQKYLKKALDYIASRDGVWLATSDEIADWYYASYYDQAVAQAAAGTQR